MTTLARGRVWVVAWAVLVLGVLGWVIARQTASVVAAGDLADLRDERTALESERAILTRRVRQAESREVLQPKAEAMGLRVPADSEATRLPWVRPGRNR